MPSADADATNHPIYTTAEFRRLVPVSDGTLRAWRTKGMPYVWSPGGRPMYTPEGLAWVVARQPGVRVG
jgi:hypothetical protein